LCVGFAYANGNGNGDANRNGNGQTYSNSKRGSYTAAASDTRAPAVTLADSRWLSSCVFSGIRAVPCNPWFKKLKKSLPKISAADKT
jgi:hypothetical protein